MPVLSATSDQKDLLRKIIRTVSGIVVLVGIFLLIRVFYNTVNGSLVLQLFPNVENSPWYFAFYAMALSIPVPFHVISVGFVLQKRWISPSWEGVIQRATVISGCMLGVSLAIKAIFL